MPRDVDEKKKRKALRKLRKAAALAEQGLGPPLSDWEKQFLEEVEERIENYGSAFADPEKGGRDEPLSALQSVKLREIDKKARGKSKSGFKSKKSSFSKSKPAFKPNTRQLDEELEPGPDETILPEPKGPQLVPASQLEPPQAPRSISEKARPKLRVIKGGADEA